MDMRKVGPPGLEPQVTERLLDLLSTDDSFRELFVQDVNAALVVAGYVPQEKNEYEGITAAGPGDCLRMDPANRLASKEKIIRERSKLERILNGIQHFDCPSALRAD